MTMVVMKQKALSSYYNQNGAGNNSIVYGVAMFLHLYSSHALSIKKKIILNAYR